MDKKLFGKFNIIDIILFSIVALAIIGAVVRILWNGPGEYEEAEITATFVSENFRSETVLYLSPGIELVNEADNSVVGRVVDYGVNDDGILTVTTFSKGSKLKRGISLDGKTYFVGSEVSLISGDAVFDAYLSKIDAVTEK